MRATDLMIWGLVLHLVADWLLQNDWMAANKSNLRHAAAYVHSGIHLAAAMIVFPAWAALLIAVTHLLIDTRKPLEIWRRLYGQTVRGEAALLIPLGFWQDQVAHIAVIALMALMVAR
jgi:hypothetical protein